MISCCIFSDSLRILGAMHINELIAIAEEIVQRVDDGQRMSDVDLELNDPEPETGHPDDGVTINGLHEGAIFTLRVVA